MHVFIALICVSKSSLAFYLNVILAIIWVARWVCSSADSELAYDAQKCCARPRRLKCCLGRQFLLFWHTASVCLNDAKRIHSVKKDKGRGKSIPIECNTKTPRWSLFNASYRSPAPLLHHVFVIPTPIFTSKHLLRLHRSWSLHGLPLVNPRGAKWNNPFRVKARENVSFWCRCRTVCNGNAQEQNRRAVK